MQLVLIRQRPAIGDCLLLAPLIREIKARYLNSQLTVITDASYASGALVDIFKRIPGVDHVESVPQFEWTTEGNKEVDVFLRTVHGNTPRSVTKADRVFDCNSAFIQYERDHQGKPPLGIAEFWLKHHELYSEGCDLLPVYTPRCGETAAAHLWQAEHGLCGNEKKVGIVLRAGDPVRDWDWKRLAPSIVDWLHTSGYSVITFDPIMKLGDTVSHACIGERLPIVATLLRSCEVILTPDTGLLHLAEAVGTKTVALWGIMEPRLRIEGYNTIVVPPRSLGYCQGGELESCMCRWKFQQWSCLHRLTLPMIIRGLEQALA